MERLEKLLKSFKENESVNRFLADYGSQLKKIAIISVLIIAVLFTFAIKGNDEGVAVTEENDNAKSTKSRVVTIFVDIGGAVNSPMLAELPEGSRVEDAIVAAGGLAENADLSSINRAEFLEDGEKIYIPAFVKDADGNDISESDTSSAGTATAASGASVNSKVNINTADSIALQTLNGVGPATAQKIIDYRMSNGRFLTTEDLKNVSGIGDKTYEKLKDFITT